MERFKLSPCGRYMGLHQHELKGKNGVADFAWWRDGEGLTVVGKGGEVGEWNMESGSFVALWNDDGSIGATVLALGGSNGPKQLGGDRWVVIGSQSGVVNIYDRKNFVSGKDIKIPQRPEPNRRFLQLTTPTSHLQISPDGQLLAFGRRISSVAFGSGSDVLAVGNEAGKIRLWEIRS
ncbi:hypothetical protein DID88_005935 [Monilinia fructigena]|uniref:Uncharacterized protein n=1 Tax=Monilinia fructigena TaxID=38457 RepID=A0A395J2E2_9HELO|nr:hypothetical protein DID88_005935 [Monilinia fructigena]